MWMNLDIIFNWLIFKNKMFFYSDLSAFSFQFKVCSAADRSFTPESWRSLLLRSSSLTLEDWEPRNEDRALQLLSERLQILILKKKQRYLWSD